MKKKIYLVRKRALGDVLWIEPVIRQLLHKYKRVIVYTKYPVLFDNYPFNKVQCKSKLKFWEKLIIKTEELLNFNKLSINLDNSYETKNNIHILNAYQSKACLPLTEEYPCLYLSEEEKERQFFPDKYVVLHLESLSDKKFRHVFGVNWNEIVDFFKKRGFGVIQTGIQPIELPGSIYIKTSIRELISLLNKASFFIGIDSGPSHLAASLKIPSMIFFGAVNPELRHFKKLFNGILMKKNCEYDNQQDIILKEDCKLCHWSENPEIPICCLYSTKEVVLKIQHLLEKYAK